jgi:hypothetical protein
MPVGLQNPQRMGFEGHGHRRATHGGRLFDHLVKQGLVADVHPVEIADRQDGIWERFFNIFNIFYQYHACASSEVKSASNFGLTGKVKNFS